MKRSVFVVILVAVLVLGSVSFVDADPTGAKPTSVPSPSGQLGLANADVAAGQLSADLAAFAAARQLGPEAAVALGNTLRGRALDIVHDEFTAARAQLAAQAQALMPSGATANPIDEEAAARAQAALDAASRARAFAPRGDALGDAPDGVPADGVATDGLADAIVPAATDRTVGNGCTYATINAALAASHSGDRLLLEGGRTFTEHLSVDIFLTVQGGYAGCASGSSARTTISGGGVSRVIYIYSNVTVKLTNLNLTNGHYDGNGGGVYVGPGSQLVGTNLDIYNNIAHGGYGGGVRLYGATATFTNTNIYDNTAIAGAGVHAMKSGTDSPTLNLSYYADVHDNDAVTGEGLGGGIYVSEGTVFLSDCSDLYYNHAIEGGGAYLITSTLTIQGSCSEIDSNRATGNGGGIYALGSTVNFDDDAELLYNRAGTDGTGSGGGAYLDNSKLWVDKAAITSNTAHEYGGGVYATNGSLLDMDVENYACAWARCSRLSYNTATDQYGGGVFAGDNSEVDLREVFVENNTAYLGGGIYAFQSKVYLYNVLLARNDATHGGLGAGDGIRLYTGASLVGSHNTIANNDSGGATTGLAIAVYDGTLTLSNSIVWGHTTSIDLAGQTVTCSDVQHGYAGTDNLNVSPLFVDSANGDFHLRVSSAVIDRCASGRSVDFEKQHRPTTRYRPSTPYDMGADEVLFDVFAPLVHRNN